MKEFFSGPLPGIILVLMLLALTPKDERFKGIKETIAMFKSFRRPKP